MKIRPSVLQFLHVLRHINGVSAVYVSCTREGDAKEYRRKGGRKEIIQILSHIFQPAHTTYSITITSLQRHTNTFIIPPTSDPCTVNRISTLVHTFRRFVLPPPIKTVSLRVLIKPLAYRRVGKKVHPQATFFLSLSLLLSPRRGGGAYHNATRFAEIQTEND